MPLLATTKDTMNVGYPYYYLVHGVECPTTVIESPVMAVLYTSLCFIRVYVAIHGM